MTAPSITKPMLIGMSSLTAATLMSLIGWLLVTTNKLDVSVGRLTVQVEALEHRDARLTEVERRVGAVERRGQWQVP